MCSANQGHQTALEKILQRSKRGSGASRRIIRLVNMISLLFILLRSMIKNYLLTQSSEIQYCVFEIKIDFIET